MDKQSRREAIRDYKERATSRGVFAVRCRPTGQVWVAASRNLAQQQNAIWFGLKAGGYVNRAAQAAWNVASSRRVRTSRLMRSYSGLSVVSMYAPMRLSAVSAAPSSRAARSCSPTAPSEPANIHISIAI